MPPHALTRRRTRLVAAITAATLMSAPLAARARGAFASNTFMAAGQPLVTRQATGNADLDRAVAACDRHRIAANAAAGATPSASLAWASGWAACSVVESQYDASAAIIAAAAATAAAQDSADQAFVNQFAAPQP